MDQTLSFQLQPALDSRVKYDIEDSNTMGHLRSVLKPVNARISITETGTGHIARAFACDLLLPPSTRGTSDLEHQLVAVASSSSIESARSFISDNVKSRQSLPCVAYGTYRDLVELSHIDIVYVATPHSHHFQHCMLCIEAGKAVLCEKPLVINAAQARTLQIRAAHRNVLLMEALWTRFLPVSQKVKQLINDNHIGEVLRVYIDLSLGIKSEQLWDVSHRMVSKALAGGALLDLGIYNLSWALFVLYDSTRQESRPSVVGSLMTLEPRTKVDEATTILLEFPPRGTSERPAHALVTTAFRPGGNDQICPPIRLEGDKGEIQLFGPIYRPDKIKIISKGVVLEEINYSYDAGVQGMGYEADEAARCRHAGKLESEVIPWQDTILMLEIMDKVRSTAELEYPEALEKAEVTTECRT